MSVPPTACAPPPRTFAIGAGSEKSLSLLKYLNKGVPFESDAAFAQANDKATATFPPKFEKLEVPSISLSV